MKMKLLSTRKDSKRREWVVMKDPVTGEEAPRHYSLDSFNCRLDDKNKRHGVYSYFFKRNNDLVNVASQWSIDLGEDYDRFFEQGLRVSQQISVLTKGVGRDEDKDYFFERPKTFAEICEEDLERKTKDLEEKLLGEVRQAKKRTRDEQYDSLVPVLEEGTSQEDLQYGRELITRLKSTEVTETTSSILGERSFEQRAIDLSEDGNKELLQVFPEIHPNLRPLFLHIARYAELNGNRNDFLKYHLEDVSTLLGRIGPENGGLYLSSLLTALERDENVYEFRQLVGYDVNGDLGEEQFEEYFTSVHDIQRMGYEGDSAIALTDSRLELSEEQRGKYDAVLKKLTDIGFRQFSVPMMDDIVRRKPEVLEDPTIVDGIVDVYKASGEREAFYSFLRSFEK